MAKKRRFDFTKKNKRSGKVENVGYLDLEQDEEQSRCSLYFYGDIVSATWESMWYEEDRCPQDIADFLNQLDGYEDINIYFNSGGGDVFAGLAIYNQLKRYSGHKVGYVDGMAASIASVIMFACDELHFATGAQAMIHNGYFLYIIGMDARKNIEFSNATAMCLKNKYIQYVCKLEKMNKAILLSEKQKTNLHWDEKITCESNLELYRELTEKHLHSIYQRHPRSIGKCLADGEGAFKLLDIEEQVKIICDIVQYTSFQRGVFSLKVLGGPKEVGRIRISGNMTEAKECKLVNYSITGMYKTEMDLLKK